MDAWIAGVLGGLVSGMVGGLLSGVAVYEYQVRREAGHGRIAATRELRAAFGDFKAYWRETAPDGLSAIERDNLVSALDILRDTLLRNSTHFPPALLDEVQSRTARLRAVVLRVPLEDAEVLGAVGDPLSGLEAIIPSE